MNPTQSAFRNVTVGNTQKLRAALAHAVSKTGRGRIVILGDSITSGYMSNGPDRLDEAHSKFGAQLARQLEARGWNVRQDSFMGDGMCDATDTALAADPRLSYEGAELYDTAYPTLGGRIWSLATPGWGFTFHPGRNFNTVDVLIPTNGGPGTLAVFFQGDSFNGDAGGIADVQFYDASGAAGMRKHTFTVPQELVTDGVAGKARSVQFKSTGLGNAFVTGATTRDTTNPGLEIIVAGVAGGRMADWSRDVDTNGFNDTTFNVVPSLAALLDDAATVPTTFIVEGWANDWEANHSITTTQVKALAASLIAKLQPYGDVIWMGYAPMTPEYGGTDLESLIPVYNEAVFAAANDAGCAVVDPRVLFPDWTTGYTVLGLNADAQHPTAAGHAIIARAIIAALDAAF